MTSIDIAKTVANILDNKKAIDVSILGVRKISSLTDYFVIASGTSSTQVKALADEVEFKLKQFNIIPEHIEGHNSNSWALLDYGNVIVNIFSEEARQFYNLEHLWKDSERIEM